MTHWTFHKVNVFPGVNSQKKKKFIQTENSINDTISDGWNKFIMEYTYLRSHFLIYIYIYFYIYIYIYIYSNNVGCDYFILWVCDKPNAI